MDTSLPAGQRLHAGIGHIVLLSTLLPSFLFLDGPAMLVVLLPILPFLASREQSSRQTSSHQQEEEGLFSPALQSLGDHPQGRSIGPGPLCKLTLRSIALRLRVPGS